MENLDYIKWLISQAEGFTLNGDQLIFPEGGVETFSEYLIGLKVWKLVWFPLLLLRAADSLMIMAHSDKERSEALRGAYREKTGRNS